MKKSPSSSSSVSAPTTKRIRRTDWNKSRNAYAAKKAWRDRNPERVWASYAVISARARARKKGLKFEITPEYLMSILPRQCPVFKTKFSFVGNRWVRPMSPTIDRLDNSKGYVRGNAVVISMKANIIKNAFSTAEVAAVARWMRKMGCP